MADVLSGAGKDVLGIGKIYDIFAGRGITSTQRTKNNDDGIEKTIETMKTDFNGLCFVNLVDFDMVYGHRNDVAGYTAALNRFDEKLPEIIGLLRDDDILMITADHGCDPVTPSTDHSREYTPLLVYGKKVRNGVNLGIRESFSDIGATVCAMLGVEADIAGKSFMEEIIV